MELTKHGFDHIVDRTRLFAKDVLALIASGAVVELGVRDGYEYLLFYSHPDGAAKIAVVTKGRTHLVSIWERDFGLPEGVLPPTDERVRKARKAFKRFMFKRTGPGGGGPGRAMIVEVWEGAYTAYREELGIIPSEQAHNVDSVIRFFGPRLQEIFTAVDENQQKVKLRGNVRYAFITTVGNGKSASVRWHITHRVMRKRLKRSSS